MSNNASSRTERHRSQDYVDLMAAANRAISSALADGDRGGKHAPGSWMKETVEGQLKHIEAHLAQYQCCDRRENHLAHIVCRAAIASALADRYPQEGF